MNYGKITDGKLLKYSGSLESDGKKIFTNDESLILSAGFKPIIYTEQPEGNGYTFSWAETENNITQVWQQLENFDSQPSTEERLEALEDAMLEMLGVTI